MKPALLVLAAGMGSRYGGLKQIDPVGPSGEIILDYSIYDALKSGFGKVVFVIRRDIEQAFRNHIGAKWEKRIPVEYAFQELDKLPVSFHVPDGRIKPWGTGHAILCAKEKISEPFAAINADDFYGRNGYALLAESFRKNKNPAKCHFMVGFTLRNTLSENGSVARGVCRCDSNGFLSEVTERTNIVPDGKGGAFFTDSNGAQIPLTGDEIVSMNMWGFMPGIFDSLSGLFEQFLSERGTELKSEFYIPSAVASLIHSGNAEIKVMKSGDSWFGVTYREDKPLVQASIARLIQDKIYPSPLE